MIIRVDNINRVQYEELFTRAYQDLVDKGVTVETATPGRFTSLEEFFSNIQHIIAANRNYLIRIPVDEPVLAIDANKRTIDTSLFSKCVNVQSDQIAETVIFSIDRYYDYMDLANTSCIIQYITPDKSPYVYIVPYYDIYTYRGLNKMIIPWNIDGAATQKAGTVTYSIRFFRIEPDENGVNKLVYNLNTLAAETQILDSLNVDPLNKEEVDFGTDAYEIIMHELSTLNRKGTYWEILD